MTKSRAVTKATQIWNDYMTHHNMRRTMERNSILTATLGINGHFTAADLEAALRADGFNFSTATVYSALALFVDAGILQKLSLGNRAIIYERSMALAGNSRTRQRHNHLVCTACGRIAETRTPEVSLNSIGGEDFSLPGGFEASDVSLTFFGLCAKCRRSAGKKRKTER